MDTSRWNGRLAALFVVLSLGVAIVGCVPTSSDGTNLRLEGTVRTDDGAPIQGATVTLSKNGPCIPVAGRAGQNGGTATWVATRMVYGTACMAWGGTDAEGRYQLDIEMTCGGDVLFLGASAVGYEPHDASNRVQCTGRLQTIDLELTPAAPGTDPADQIAMGAAMRGLEITLGS